MNDNDSLFSKQLFHDVAQAQKEALMEEIQGYDMASVLAVSIEELAKYFEGRYLMDLPHIKSSEIYLLEVPREISTRERIQDRSWGDEDEYINVDRTYIQFTVCVPFEGDASLFDLRPTSYSYDLSRKMSVSIHGSEIHIVYQEMTSNSKLDYNALYEKDVQMIEANLQHLAVDVESFNREIPGLIKVKLNERRRDAEKNQSIIQAFKIPIKKRDDIPTTYIIPEIRKKPSIIESPKVKTFISEPTLASEEYENILGIIKDMALAMERSPKTFISLDEEDIRNFFIILLNGHYQGSATGETFNGEGKTDILIRYKNANAFIAECKFWGGQKKMTEAIDQLLGYITWRDTKTSILLFNKQPDLSAVITKANETIRQHKNFKAEYQLVSKELKDNETIFAYKFIHPSDPEKEIYLTLMAFQINK
jgi:hypothetical protein